MKFLSVSQAPFLHPMIGAWLELAAELAARRGDIGLAVELYEVADREQKLSGINRWNPVPGWGAWHSEARDKLGDAAYEAAAERGRSMSIDDALKLARQPLGGP